MKTKQHNSNQKGFTIVELMMALAVLSTVLLISTFIIIQIGSLFSKGVNSSKLQNMNRNVVADISASLQFGGDKVRTPSPNPVTHSGVDVYAYCVGKVRYSYVIARELGENASAQYTPKNTTHVLWRDKMGTAADACVALDITKPKPTDASSTGGSELLSDHMMITKFSMVQHGSGKGSSADVAVWLAFGESDLLCDTGTPDNCKPNQFLPVSPIGQVLCRGDAGQQFCATSQINTTVADRKY